MPPGRNNGSRGYGAGGDSRRASAAFCGKAPAAAGTRLRLDSRISAVDGNYLCVGARPMGASAPFGGEVGGRPLDPAPWWMGVRSRALALREDSE
jgi:hypothetical protein